jgi:hypothetical protein
MKKPGLLLILLISNLTLFAQNEIGPDGGKLVWLLLILAVVVLVLVILGIKGNNRKPLFVREKVKVDFEKSKLYFPDSIKLSVKNTGNVDVDVDRPVLIFDSFWIKRKFKLKGIDNRSLYPLYLGKGETHNLNIDLNHFYSYDKKLKKYAKVKIAVFNVKGKSLGKKAVYIRKTLIKY